MVTHIVLWKFNPNIDPTEMAKIAQQVKLNVENLTNIIDGIIELKFEINPLESSTHDVALVSKFTDEQALKNYQIHPEHVKAGQIIKQYFIERACIDF